jgi:hypothetical protein
MDVTLPITYTSYYGAVGTRLTDAKGSTKYINIRKTTNSSLQIFVNVLEANSTYMVSYITIGFNIKRIGV